MKNTGFIRVLKVAQVLAKDMPGGSQRLLEFRNIGTSEVMLRVHLRPD